MPTAILSGGWTAGRLKLFAAGSYRRSDGYRPNTDFDNWNGYVRMTWDSERAGYFDLQGRLSEPRFRLERLLCRLQSRPVRGDPHRAGFGALGEGLGRFHLSASAGYRKNFDRYDWTRGKEAGRNRHATDNVSSEVSADYHSQAGITTLGAITPTTTSSAPTSATGSRCRTATIRMPRAATRATSGCVT